MAAATGKAFRFVPANRLLNFLAPTVWHEFTPLATECKAVNLGQGFPGWQTPDFVKRCGKNGIFQDYNQYTRSAGHPKLVKCLAKMFSKHLNRTIDPFTEVIVTVGASQALFNVALSLLNPGDEVVVFEPAFDIYLGQVDMAGGVLRPVTLRVKGGGSDAVWSFDVKELENAFTSKTRLLILNTPHNPTGKVFTRAELELISKIVKKYPNVVIVCDEVYEHLTFDALPHVRMASLPGMFDRTITVSSAGKTFSVTGWKIGWAVGPSYLIRPSQIAHQWNPFSICTPLQVAIAEALAQSDKPYHGCVSYYKWLNGEYARKRLILSKILKDCGITPFVPQGAFYIVGDTSRLKVPEKYLADKTVTRDWALCRWLTIDIGVCAIPVSAFYSKATKHLAKNYIRFAFCKPDESLIEAGKRLTKLKNHLRVVPLEKKVNEQNGNITSKNSKRKANTLAVANGNDADANNSSGNAKRRKIQPDGTS